MNNFLRKKWRPLSFVIVLTLAVMPTHLFAQVTFDEARKVHALLVLDTDSNLGERCLAADEWRMTFLLESAIPKAQLQITKLKGKEVTPNRVLAYYHNLQNEPDDVLFFYYSGHGSCCGGRHQLNGQHGTVCRDTVRQAMSAKRARLFVLLTDCCASIVPDAEFARSKATCPVIGEPVESPITDARILRQLLLRTKGTADLTASAIGHPAWCHPLKGGVFTKAFFNVVAQSRVEELMNARPIEYTNSTNEVVVTWDSLFKQLKKEIPTAAEELSVPQVQSPHFFSLPFSHRTELTSPNRAASENQPQIMPQRFRVRAGIEGADFGDGVLVKRKTPGLPAHEAGFVGGEIIQSVDGVLVTRWEQVFTLIQRAEANGTMRLRGYDHFTQRTFDRTVKFQD